MLIDSEEKRAWRKKPWNITYARWSVTAPWDALKIIRDSYSVYLTSSSVISSSFLKKSVLELWESNSRDQNVVFVLSYLGWELCNYLCRHLGKMFLFILFAKLSWASQIHRFLFISRYIAVSLSSCAFIVLYVALLFHFYVLLLKVQWKRLLSESPCVHKGHTLAEKCPLCSVRFLLLLS